MPVRCEIHSSDVSTTFSSSLLGTRLAGAAAPMPIMLARSSPCAATTPPARRSRRCTGVDGAPASRKPAQLLREISSAIERKTRLADTMVYRGAIRQRGPGSPEGSSGKTLNGQFLKETSSWRACPVTVRPRARFMFLSPAETVVSVNFDIRGGGRLQRPPAMAVTENAAIVGGDFADIVDGPALVSGEGDEAVDEVIATDDGSSTKDAFSRILQELEVMLMDEEFNERVDAFAEEHCHEFEDSDENKLIYTTLFNDYSAMVETFIEERLGASVQSFDMAGFCATLAERAKANDGDLPPPLEMLHSMTDFDAFKELMLSAKQGKAVEAMNGSLSVCGAKLGIDTVGPAANLPGLEDEEGGEVRSELDGMGLSISGLSISPSKSK